MKKNISISVFVLFIISCGNEVSNDSSNSNQNINDTVYTDQDYHNIDTMSVSEDDLKKAKDQLNELVDTIPDSSIKKIEKDLNDKYVKDDHKHEINYTTNPSSNKTETLKNKIVEKKTDSKSSPIKIDPIIVDTQFSKVVSPKVQAEIHKTWDDLVRKHISSSGKVNYAGFKKDKAQIEKYIKELQSYHPKISAWNKNKRLAYWINVYNAVTVKLIVDNYPVKSILDLHGGKPWDQKLINLGGVSYSLDVIENKIIIAKFKEPRIHFAVNCAAKSCPKIMNKAWTEGNIQRYLTKQTKAFLANSTHNKITADKLELSKIFDWYKKDFGGDNGKLIKFINKYSDTKVNENATITFNEYNWKLNN